MKNYKKRTIALCLASLITVVGAFGSDLYNNHLMSLDIKKDSNGTINVTAYTEKTPNSEIKTFKQDSNTHVIIIPETDSKAQAPDIKNYPNIRSINIETFPYTNNQSGYTKIVIETFDSSKLEAKTMLFLPNTKTNVQNNTKQSYWDSHEDTSDKVYDTRKGNPSTETSDKQTERISSQTNIKSNKNTIPEATAPSTPQTVQTNNFNDRNEPIAIILCGSILLMIIGFIILIGKDKMASVVGEKNQIDLNSDTDNKTPNEKNKKNIRKTINSLDKTYINKQSIEASTPEKSIEKNLTKKDTKTNIINLDELFNQKKQLDNTSINNTDIANDDLADFLKEFSFDENEEAKEIKEEEIKEEKEESFNENLYDEIINHDELKFSDEDIKKLNKLLQLEISSETRDALAEQMKKEIQKPKHLTQKQILEDLVTTYFIKQNVTFSSEDIKAIKDIMNVELDKDFVADLRTNSKRVKEVEKEIQAPKSYKQKKSDILTINVKDFLPNLAEELKKQGNKPIESEAKPDVVFFSEGYEYQKLSVSDDLADISKALESKDATEHKESYSAPIVDSGYEVSTLSIKDELPDLEDVIKNPQKYEDKKKDKVEVDEKALLKSISNVTFKPFYEEVQEEMNQFSNFEIINDRDFFDETPTVKKDRISKKYRAKINIDAQNLLKLIEEQKQAKKIKEQDIEKEKNTIKTEAHNPVKEDLPKEVLNNDIIKTILINKDAECSLIKTENGYDIVGYLNDKKFKLKHYNVLKSTNMQIRAQEKDKQYLIKLGLHKFVINITDDNMEFVMDLC